MTVRYVHGVALRDPELGSKVRSGEERNARAYGEYIGTDTIAVDYFCSSMCAEEHTSVGDYREWEARTYYQPGQGDPFMAYTIDVHDEPTVDWPDHDVHCANCGDLVCPLGVDNQHLEPDIGIDDTIADSDDDVPF